MRASRLAGPALVAAFAAFGIALVATSRAGEPGPRAVPTGTWPRTGRIPAEDEAVDAASGPTLRPATDADATESDGRDELRTLYGDYRPFFARGDLNGDGRIDFAQAFVRREGPEPLFDVAVFFGTGAGYAAPVWVERGVPLAAGDLSVDRSVLVVTDDVDQDSSRRWRWNPASGRFVDVDGEAGEDDGTPWTEPEGWLGTTA